MRLYSLLDPLTYHKVCACHDWVQSGKRVNLIELALRYELPLPVLAEYLEEVDQTGAVTVPSIINRHIETNNRKTKHQRLMKYAHTEAITCMNAEHARDLRLILAGWSSTQKMSTEGSVTTVTTTLPISRLRRALKKALGYMPEVEQLELQE